MRLNLPWWLNPWAEVRRLRVDVARHCADADRAVQSAFDVQCRAGEEIRHSRHRERMLVAQNEELLRRIVDMAHQVPNVPVFFTRKED